MKEQEQVCARRWLVKYSEIVRDLHDRYARNDRMVEWTGVVVGAFTATSIVGMLAKIDKESDVLKWIALGLTVVHTGFDLYQKSKLSYKKKVETLKGLADEADQNANRLESSDEFDLAKFLELCQGLESELKSMDASSFKSGLIGTMIGGNALNGCLAEIARTVGGPGPEQSGNINP